MMGLCRQCGVATMLGIRNHWQARGCARAGRAQSGDGPMIDSSTFSIVVCTHPRSSLFCFSSGFILGLALRRKLGM
jgi:hypothetical protein